MKIPTLLVWGSCLLFAIAAHGQTTIRSSFNGKRVLFVDGDTIRPDPSGPRLLFIDHDFLRPDPQGKRLLYVDQDGDVRPDLNGVRLASWEGTELRKTHGGLRLGLVDDKDFRPEPGYKTYFYMDGPALSRMQLTAVIYLLKPEFFQITADEKAAKQKEMAQNGAAEEARLAGDKFPGDHPILAHSTSTGAKRAGSVQVTRQGDFYGITLKTGDNPPWQGIGVKVTVPGGDQELWAGIAPAGAVSMGIYNIKGGTLNGTWIPVNIGADRSVLGYENLTGAAQIGGAYTITAGKLPNGGVAYTGSMNIDPLQDKLLDGPCYRFRWSTGTTALGFRAKDTLAVVAGWGADFEVLRLRLNDAEGLVGDFLGKTGAKGYYTLGK